MREGASSHGRVDAQHRLGRLGRPEPNRRPLAVSKSQYYRANEPALGESPFSLKTKATGDTAEAQHKHSVDSKARQRRAKHEFRRRGAGETKNLTGAKRKPVSSKDGIHIRRPRLMLDAVRLGGV